MEKRNFQKRYKPKLSQRYQDVPKLEKRIQEETPPADIYYYKYFEDEEKQADDKSKQKQVEIEEQVGLKKFIKTNDPKKVKIRFEHLPISKYTMSGLVKAKYVKMTEVQRCTIPHSLLGRDMMVCSRTGSGKTLSYLIPMVEKLYRERWGALDGLGALIIVPVRELAIQTFEVLRSFGLLHEMSAGMIIGGKQVDIEKSRIASINILVATPGRLLQHMNETPDFNCDNLRMLVLDEVDRILDMGFSEDLNQIISFLPMRNVQTLLFSATAKKSLQKLAKKVLHSDFTFFSMNNYERSIGESANNDENQNKDEAKDDEMVAKYVTPVKLTHYYMCVEAEHKLDTLFSFIKSHKDSKVIVFFSTCKQVRHAYESFSKLKVGAPLLEIHGRQQQIKRTAIYFEFVERKHAYLFATDIASRGIDFPAVDWVIQVDLPEDTDTYIHRVGRTARYKYKGNSLLMVLPSEIKFADKLKRLNIDMKKLKANPNRTLTITSALQRINAQNNDLLHLAQRAFICYLRSVHKNGDKDVFDVTKINHEEFALSLGIVTVPVIEFTQDEDKNTKKSKLQKLREKIKQKKRQAQGLPDSDEEEFDEEENEEDEELSQEYQESEDHSAHSDLDKAEVNEKDDLFTLKRTIKPDDDVEPDEPEIETKKIFSKNQLKKIKKGGISQGKNKVYFDAEGNPISSLSYHYKASDLKEDDNAEENENQDEYISKIKKSLTQTQAMDNQIAQDRLKQKRVKRKRQRDDKEKEKKLKKMQEKYENQQADAEGDNEGEGDNDNEEMVSEPQPKQKKQKNKRFKHQEVSKEQSDEDSSEEPEDL